MKCLVEVGFAVVEIAHTEMQVAAQMVELGKIALEHRVQSFALRLLEDLDSLSVTILDAKTVGDPDTRSATLAVVGDYAFEIDEPVELTLTYAPEHTDAATFMVVWDQNGGEGHGVIEITPEPGSGFRRTTVNLERARFAGLGAKQTDLAIGARRGRVALCDIAIARSNTTRTPVTFGQIELTVTEKDTGRPIPARVGIYDVTGRASMPSDDAILVNRFTDVVRRHWLNRRTMWPSDNRQAFYMDGQYSARLPVGTYELVVTRGPEYRAYRDEFEINDGKDTVVTVIPVRYANLPDVGWYSGDAHVHLGRSRVDDLAVWGQMAAEDVHVANLLEMGNIAGTYFGQPAWGIEGRFERGGYALVPGLEDPRTGHRGHTMHWNVGEKEHADADVFYQYDRVFRQTRAQGAITGYAHLGSLFNGERGLALDVPFGLIDFIEVLQGGRLTTDIWYGFLNLGYRVLPAAGADYPYFGPTLPGVERTYVQIDGVRLAAHLHRVGLLDPRARVHQIASKISVVRHEQQSFAVEIESTHRKHSASHRPDQIADGGAALGIRKRGDTAPGLVQHQVDLLPARLGHALSVHFDRVPQRVDLASRSSNGATVDLYSALLHQAFRRATRADAGRGQHLVQPFHL